jgi:eukaryotic-like serine/threonine-protein kinase
VSIKSVDQPGELPQLLQLLDQALAHAPVQRAAWLQQLQAERPDSHAALVVLLANHDAAEAEDFLNITLPAAEAARMPAVNTPPEPRVGAYELRSKLGDGGMSSVWLAERVEGTYRREVALKLLSPGFDRPGFRERLQREAQILAQLSHPRIAQLLEAGVSEYGTPYLVLELVRGRSITDYADELRLGIAARLKLLLQVCDALAYLHRNLVIHRDVKPSNILVDGSAQVKLVDFGIAKLIGEAAQQAEVTASVGLAFTPDYASPEQLRGEPLTTATDVYSAAAVGYRLLTGMRPAAGRGNLTQPSAWFGKAKMLCDEEAQRIASLRNTSVVKLAGTLEKELDAVLTKALAPDADERYASIGDLAADLTAYLEGLPVAARRPTWGYGASKFLRRHRWGAIAGALAIVGLLGMASVAMWQAQHAAASAERSQKVLAFMTDLLGQSDPNVTQGKQLTVVELLSQAVPEVRRRFAGDPTVERAILEKLSELHQELSLPEQDIEVRQALLATTVRVHGADSFEAADDERILGHVQSEARRYEECSATLTRALPRRSTFSAGKDRAQVLGLLGLSSCNKKLGQWPAAIAALRDAENLASRPGTLDAMGRARFALHMLTFHDTDPKEQARWLATFEREKLFDRLDGRTEQLNARYWSARAMRNLGHLLEADAAMSAVAADIRQFLGENAFPLEAALWMQGGIAADLMHVAQARRLYLQAFSLRQRPEQERVASESQHLGHLGLLELFALDEAAARSYWTRAKKAVDQGAKPNVSFLTLGAMQAMRDGDWAAATAFLQQTHAVQSGLGGPQSIDVMTTDLLLSNVARLQGRPADAIAAAEAVVRRYAEVLPRTEARSARARAYVAHALLDAGQFERSAHEAESAAALASQWLPADHPLIAQSKYIRAQGLERLGRRDQAAALMSDAQKSFQAKLGRPLDERLMRVLY